MIKSKVQTLVIGITTGGLLALSPLASALNIALTNDDGWNSIGITAMKEALDPDHDVTLAAPVDGQSGSSAGLDLGPVEVVKEDDGVFSVAGEPATSALIAMDIAGDPDLLISGINDGANIGTFSQISGTVGAATVALSSTFNGSIPAIAISTDPVCDDETEDGELTEECEAKNTAHFEAVANFVANFVKHLMTKPGFLARQEGLLPPRVGLNINYPPTDNVKGVKVSSQGQTAGFGLPFAPQFNFICEECAELDKGDSTTGGLDFGATVPDTSSTVKNGDTGNFEDGYITIVPFQGDITAKSPRKFKSVVNSFSY